MCKNLLATTLASAKCQYSPEDKEASEPFLANELMYFNSVFNISSITIFIKKEIEGYCGGSYYGETPRIIVSEPCMIQRRICRLSSMDLKD